ncbi:DUF423 domain-containing protein [Candidatus Vesicomyidisocius calyptogenae]|uniref:DUF423 domain-containing protein n=1 Tax=Vesicomyosocius okutanii subsp. Calyptogena okutanii (strain HA) TaxID=412965 RepID=A5CWL0_VESOH|nr:DUF423 domain-containing protein [Candidatus Vesicomyosocius okutanii]BAF61662.1 conserved hypothetical protein [Candidatus Vesicomyosocius okutanii]
MNFFWIFIALSGTMVIVMDAMSVHIFKYVLPIEDIMRIQTAITYQMYHTLIIAILAIQSQRIIVKSINQSIWLFIAGIVMFSGSLYLYTLTKLYGLFFITPIGGMLLVLGWLSIARFAFNFSKIK